MYFFCRLPFESLLSISSPEQGEGDQESGRSCSVCEYISSNEGFYILSRLASCFMAFGSHRFSVREEETLLCASEIPLLPCCSGLVS